MSFDLLADFVCFYTAFCVVPERMIGVLQCFGILLIHIPFFVVISCTHNVAAVDAVCMSVGFPCTIRLL